MAALPRRCYHGAMGGGIEAAGDLATGAAWTRAAEPVGGDAVSEPRSDLGHTVCLNCGATLVGPYCHGCGQSGHVHRTLMSIVHDLLHGVFHFEGKIWRTLPMLALHPGQLTRRYIDGERAKFVSPLALFLFSVFLMFAVYSWIGPGDLTSGFGDGLAAAAPRLAQQRAADAAKLAGLEQQRTVLATAGKPTADVDRQITDSRAELAALKRVTGKLAAGPATVRAHSDLDWLDEAIVKARENPGLVIYKVQSAAYKFSWALIFLSTPLVALLFLWRRRFGLYDHAIFVTYSIAFMTLLAIVLELLMAIDGPNWLFAILLLTVPPAHMFAQLRGAYSLSVFGALWRTTLLLVGSGVALTAFVIGVILLEIAH